MAGFASSSPDALLIHEFPLASQIIYLNHAAVAPWPRRTADAVKQFAEDSMRLGATHYDLWLHTEKDLRSQCARLTNAPSADDIALLKNTSEALSVVAHGFPWQRGDNVIISDEEFPSNRIVWESLVDRGVEVREVALTDGLSPEDALLTASDGRTRLISVSSVQYGNGLRLDLTRLGALCHGRDIAFCVDAIQGLGVIPHDVQAMHIDFLMADAHKWLLGPEGIAVFYCSAEWRERLQLYQFGWHMVEADGDFERKDWQVAQSSRRFECGSPNMVGIHALSASLSLLLELGIGEIESRVLKLARHLCDRIAKNPALELLTSPAPGRYAGIVTFHHKNIANDRLFNHLRKHHVICAPRGGGIRFSPHCYNTVEELDKALGFVAQAGAP